MSRTIRDITNQAMDALSGGGPHPRRVCGRCKSGNTYMLVSRRLQCCKTCGAASKEDSNSWMPYVFGAGIHKGKSVDSVPDEYIDRVLGFKFCRGRGKTAWAQIQRYVKVEKERRRGKARAFDKELALAMGTKIHNDMSKNDFKVPKYGDEPPFKIKPPSSLPGTTEQSLEYLERVRGEINESMGVRPEYLAGPKGKTLNILETGRIPAKKVPVIEKDRRTMCSNILWG